MRTLWGLKWIYLGVTHGITKWIYPHYFTRGGEGLKITKNKQTKLQVQAELVHIERKNAKYYSVNKKFLDKNTK